MLRLLFILAGALALFTGEAFSSENSQKSSASTAKTNYNGFDRNPLIPDEFKDEMRPFLLPATHPLKPVIDKIFKGKRVTQNPETFRKAGFQTLVVKSRSFIRVARHPLVPGYLFKVVLDSELREKRDKPEWYWFLQRCKGAEQIRDVIESHDFKHFAVPHKWIYPLSLNPAPPKKQEYKQKAVLLIVEDMDIVDEDTNAQAWKHQITTEHLDELYVIIREAKGSSYRASNIPYTRRGVFAFIDTEYPHSTPDFKRIRKSLSSNMLNYWDKKVDKRQ